MIYSPQLMTSLSRYLLGNKLKKNQKFPLILMLEPLFKCNLSCAGCGRIREYRDVLDRVMSVEECLDSVHQANAPVVSITGGEPLLHPEIDRIVDSIVSEKRFVYLCTNGLLMLNSLCKFKPSPYFNFVFHLDGLAEMHDGFAGRKGVFDNAINAMKTARKAGFQIRVNTTIYKGTDLNELEELFILLSQIPVDGILVAPAFGYEAVENDVFLSRDEVHTVFKKINGMRQRFRFYNTPVYLEFLEGKRELKCIPWSNPTRNPSGWKKPCYLITDGHAQSFRELMEDTDWSKYGVGNDPRCANCKVHYGFEADAVNSMERSLPDIWRMMLWNFRGW